MRPDVLPLEGVVERLDVAILLRGVYPDVFHLDSQVGDGLSEVLAGVLGSVVALEGQTRAVRLGHCDSLHYRLDGDIVGGHGVELVGQPFSGEYVHHVEAVASSVHLAAPDVCDVSLPELVGSGGLDRFPAGLGVFCGQF